MNPLQTTKKCIDISYVAQVKKKVGKTSEKIEVSTSCTVQELIANTLCDKYPQLGEYILSEKGTIKKIILIFIGDQKVEPNRPTEFNDGDHLTIMSPITGG